MIKVRNSEENDRGAIRRIHEAAFGRPNEADLVESLCHEIKSAISLVAERGGEVVGHILFTPVTITSPNLSSIAMGLGPVAVLPALQQQGIGSLLIVAGLQRCREFDHDVVVVLGYPDYYPRFGFQRASTKGLSWEFSAPSDAFMVAELSLGALQGRTGLVKYHPSFHQV